jgi:hypothetical protein
MTLLAFIYFRISDLHVDFANKTLKYKGIFVPSLTDLHVTLTGTEQKSSKHAK